MAERPYSARSRARTAMKASRPAGSEEVSGEEVQVDAGRGPRASALAGAMRVGSADAMLGGSILPSPVDRLLSPAKERASREVLGVELSRILESEAEQDERPAPRSAPSGEEPAEVVDEAM